MLVKKDEFSFYSAHIVANFIDGAALAVLPEDFTELSHVVPQNGLMIKLKAAIEKLMTSSFEQFSEKVRQYLIHCSVVLVFIHHKADQTKYLASANPTRKSEPPSDGQVKSKIITAQHATPVVARRQSSTLEEGDAVAYERNVQSLKDELSKGSPNNNRIHQLLKLTHVTRRGKIDSDLHAVLLKEEYPFSGFKKWVSVSSSSYLPHHPHLPPYHHQVCVLGVGALMQQNGHHYQMPVSSSSGYECVGWCVRVCVHDSKCTCVSAWMFVYT